MQTDGYGYADAAAKKSAYLNGPVTTGGSTIRKEGMFDEAFRSLDEANKELQELASRVATFTNETLGSEPETDVHGANGSEASDRASALRQRLATLRAGLAYLRHHVGRLSNI